MKHFCPKWTSALCTLLLAFFALVPPATAQAFCALRDPKRQIASLFPEADGFESVVRTVDKKAREHVAGVLPFTLHFNELGRHTLYVVREKGDVMGLVHVRSEASRWGLVEIAWALDLDLNVIGFRFQRCRDRSKSTLLEPAVSKHFEGSSFDDLRAFLDRGGEALSSEADFVPSSARALAAAAIRNSLKTIAVTEYVWRPEIAALRAQQLAHRVHPTSVRAVPLGGLFGPEVRAAIKREIGPGDMGILREQSSAFDCFDADGRRLCRVLTTPWSADKTAIELRWCFDLDGTICAVELHGGSPTDEMRGAFSSLVGTRPTLGSDCADAVHLLALEVALAQGLVASAPTEKED